MSRLPNCFAELAKSNRKGLIPFISAGDPSLPATLTLMNELVKSGVDIIELGVPFSDPVADGPVIQRASERALAKGATLKGVLELVAQFRRINTKTPVVLMSYLNPIEMLGYAQFAQLAGAAGVDGVLVVDMPPEESKEFNKALAQASISQIFMLTPTSNDERIKLVSAVASGFIYYVSLKGVTGAATLNTVDVAEKISFIRKFTNKPIAVGFGVNGPEQAANLAQVADAVIVGSAIVRLVEKQTDASQNNPSWTDEASRFVNSMRLEMDKI